MSIYGRSPTRATPTTTHHQEQPMTRGDPRSSHAWQQQCTAINTRMGIHGPATCPRCNQPVYPDNQKHLNSDKTKAAENHGGIWGGIIRPDRGGSKLRRP